MQELRLASPDLEVTVLPEVGGRIHRLRAFGIDVVRTPDDPTEHARDPFYWGSYPMLPWGGRLNSGRTEVAGRTIELTANHPDGWAIHGHAYDSPWEVVDERTLTFRGGGDGWPWQYTARMSFDVVDAEITVDLAMTNTDDGPMPAGVGLHPWFDGPPLLRIPAELAYDDNTTTSPQPMAVAGDYDLRSLSDLAVGTDTTWTGLTDRRVQLAWPLAGLRGEMSARTAGDLVFVSARPPGLDAIALEPQTHAPQGLRRLINGEPDAMTLAPARSNADVKRQPELRACLERLSVGRSGPPGERSEVVIRDRCW